MLSLEEDRELPSLTEDEQGDKQHGGSGIWHLAQREQESPSPARCLHFLPYLHLVMGALLPHKPIFHSYFPLVNLIPNTSRGLDHLVTLVLKLDSEVTEHQHFDVYNLPSLKKKQSR